MKNETQISLSNSELLTKIKSLCAEERQLTLEILNYLREVDDRKLYALRGFSSLHEFCVKELAYSSGAAWRRIESMRLLRDVEGPGAEVVENKIKSGTLSLTTLSKVRAYLKTENMKGQPVQRAEKFELLSHLAGKSTREVEREIVRRAPEMASKFQERVRPLSAAATEIKLIADEELMELLQKVRELSGLPGEDLRTIVKKIARFYIGKKNRAGLIVSAPRNKTETHSRSRHVPVGVQRQVRLRAGGRCEYHDPLTGRRCEARTGLQIDHKKPFALGGDHSLTNLQLLCTIHNHLQAVQVFGLEKMHRPFSTPRPVTF